MSERWREDALCRQTDPNLFHPAPGCSPAPAKRTCMACPVRPECLDYALDTRQHWGVWGGLDQNELRRLNRARRAQAA
ncbi:WhiB family transcriptional regulator [Streptomyces sp. NRRL B-24720]|uniref:WhiB family transcriptional regulator n=1 Tax=Streptomyces sp. NRRL B-24720 TaxID=1476876 RepID=UPI00099B37A6|nr:WhiB family transcriptional regulator [Streptomyces sp. NRRL B-24720]